MLGTEIAPDTEDQPEMRFVPPGDAPLSCLTMSRRSATVALVAAGVVAVVAGWITVALASDDETSTTAVLPMVLVLLAALGTAAMAWKNLAWLRQDPAPVGVAVPREPVRRVRTPRVAAPVPSPSLSPSSEPAPEPVPDAVEGPEVPETVPAARPVVTTMSVLSPRIPAEHAPWAPGEAAQPAAEEPLAAEPAGTAPSAEAPATEVHATPEPATQVHAAVEPATHVHTAEPGEEPVAVQPTSDHPAAEAPAAAEPATEVHATPEPAAEHPVAAEPAPEDPAADLAPAEEPAPAEKSATEDEPSVAEPAPAATTRRAVRLQPIAARSTARPTTGEPAEQSGEHPAGNLPVPS